MSEIRLGNLGWKNNTAPVSPTNPWDTKDVNSDDIKGKLEQARALLAGVATEEKLEQARALLQSIAGKDFATQATLAQVKSELELAKAELAAIKANQLSGDQKVQIFPQYKDVLLDDWAELQGEGGASYVKDRDALAKLEQARVLLAGVATETKLEEARALLESVAGKDFATQATLAQVKSELELVKAELAAIKANQLSGDQKVQLSGAKVVESAPATGIKTVTSTVAEVFAGASRKANRSKLVIRNLHQAVAIRIGGSGITDTIGQSLEPGASVGIDFSPSTTVPIYAVSTAGNVSVEVLEV